MRRRRTALLVLCLAGTLGACGGSSSPEAGAPSASAATGTPSPSSGPTRVVVAATEGPPVSRETPAASATPSQSAPSEEFPDHVPGTRQAPLEIRLASGCVRPGGTQTITVKSKPKLQLAWGTEYSDRTGHPEYKGYGTHIFGPDGTYTSTWTIPPGAPQGETRTDVTVAGTIDGEDWTALGRIFWRISADC